MKKEAIVTGDAPRAIGPYSQAVRANGMVFVSGQIPLDPASGELVPGGIEAQAERVIDNLRAVLAAAGCGLGDIARTTIFLTDLAHFGAVNEIYGRALSAPYPARATVQVAALPRGALLEIDAIAFAP
jgi:2-iminobutanoate/2-iminopropanoate deaminase